MDSSKIKNLIEDPKSRKLNNFITLKNTPELNKYNFTYIKDKLILKKQRLDQILVDRNLAETKSKAQAMIMAGQIYVEGNPINKTG